MENIERNRSTQAILIRRNKIKENLRELLHSRKMTITELGKQAHIPYSTVYNYLKGNIPKKDNLLAMAKVLKCEPDDIDPSYLQVVKVTKGFSTVEDAKVFSNNLEMLMARKGVSNTQLTQALDVSPTAIGAWLRGVQPTNVNLFKLAEYFNVQPDDLIKPDLADRFRELSHSDGAVYNIGRHIPKDLPPSDQEKIIAFIEFIKSQNKA